MSFQQRSSPVQKKKKAAAAPVQGRMSGRRSNGRMSSRPDGGAFTGDQQRDDPDLCRDEKTKARDGHEYKRMEGKLFKYGVRASDVAQGWMSNCYFGAALGAVAQRYPDKIMDGIVDRGGDVFAVRFYKFDKNDQPSEEWVEVDADFPWYKDKETWAYMQSTQKGEIWPSLVEKAYAVFKSKKGKGDYDNIGQGGWESEVMEAMTGHWAEEHGLNVGPDDVIWEKLKKASDNGQAMTAGTYSPKYDESGSHEDPRYGDKTKIWENHAYTVMGVKEVGRGRGKKRMVILRNPWGESEPDGNGKDDGVFMITLAEFRRSYESVTMLDDSMPG